MATIKKPKHAKTKTAKAAPVAAQKPSKVFAAALAAVRKMGK